MLYLKITSEDAFPIFCAFIALFNVNFASSCMLQPTLNRDEIFVVCKQFICRFCHHLMYPLQEYIVRMDIMNRTPSESFALICTSSIAHVNTQSKTRVQRLSSALNDTRKNDLSTSPR
jgi:hypothetical protein